MTRCTTILGAAALAACLVTVPAGAQLTKLDWKLTTVGKVRQVLTNQGTLNKASTRFPGLINCEFPPGSGEEHLYQGGFWVGGITAAGDTAVSVTQSHFGYNEFYPTSASWDTIWVGSKGDTLDIPYWPKYVPVSDQDFVCRYSDDNLTNIPDHNPMGIDIIQTTYSWGSGQLDEFLLHTYYIVFRKTPPQHTYLAFWMHGSAGTINCGDNFIDEYTLYVPQYHLMAEEDSPGFCDGQAYSPVAFSVMSPTDPSLKWSFNYYEHETLPARDPTMYAAMSGGNIMPDRLDPSRAHIIMGFGPFEPNKGDTIKVVMAEILGNGMKGVLKNAAYLDFLKSKSFRVPSPPPRPTLRAATRNNGVLLNWTPQPGPDNPETYTDPYRGDTVSQPFAGYRLYKSTKSINGPWTLLADYGVLNEPSSSQTGIQHSYADAGLLNNIEYYYSITAYSKPDKVINFPAQESSVSANAMEVVPGTAPPSTVGQVAVVPNPYRGDVPYSSYNPPWEKPSGSRPWWMEQDRRIQFTNLPQSCDIKIYTLAGDLVNTIRHADVNKGYEDWNLTSSVGQAVSSGIYLFTCEDLASGKVQVGKFVIIK
jgi:hypothetical protein